VQSVGIFGTRKRNEQGRQFLLRQATRQHISEAEYERELQSLNREDEKIAYDLQEMRQLATDRDAQALALGQTRSLLGSLRDKADGNLTFAQRRAVVRALVAGILVEPVESQSPKITVTYTFEPHNERSRRQWANEGVIAANATAVRADINSTELKRECRRGTPQFKDQLPKQTFGTAAKDALRSELAFQAGESERCAIQGHSDDGAGHTNALPGPEAPRFCLRRL